jgi:uncharacterized protein YuzE
VRIAYDAQADALSLVFVDGATQISREIAPGLIASFDGAGKAVGLEILQASVRLGPAGLAQIVIDLSGLREGAR